jgi:hypothetical protein
VDLKPRGYLSRPRKLVPLELFEPFEIKEVGGGKILVAILADCPVIFGNESRGPYQRLARV